MGTTWSVEGRRALKHDQRSSGDSLVTSAALDFSASTFMGQSIMTGIPEHINDD